MPAIVITRPARRAYRVVVPDMRRDPVLVDDLAHVFQDFVRRCDRRAGPRLEAVAESVEVAVRPDAGKAVGPPRAAEGFLGLEHDKARTGTLLRQVIGRADAGDAGADDHDIEMLGLRRWLCRQIGVLRHQCALLSMSQGVLPAGKGGIRKRSAIGSPVS